MIEILRVDAEYRLAAASAGRNDLVRRLDHVLANRLAGAVEQAVAALGPLADLDRPDGPVVHIRRLDLDVWVEAAAAEGDLARALAASLVRAVQHRLAQGGPSLVARYRSRADELASWLADVVDDRARGRWEYAEFRHLDGVRPGRAAAAVLGANRDSIASTLAELRDAGRLEDVIRSLDPTDVTSLWEALTGGPPTTAGALDRQLVTRLIGAAVERQPVEAGTGTGARARAALRWLIALTTGPLRLPPRTAAPLALQLGHLGALNAAVADLGAAIGAGRPASELQALVETAGRDLPTAVAWFQEITGDPSSLDLLGPLTALVRPPTPTGPPGDRTDGAETANSSHAGVALLLDPIRDLGLDRRLGPDGIHHLLGLAAGRPDPDRPDDRALRWLAGLDDVPTASGGADRSGEPSTRWPDETDPGEILEAVVARFRTGLRGVERASLDYVKREFLLRPGVVTRSRSTIAVRLDGVALRILLRLGGRLGDRGPFSHLGDRRLVLEAPDG